jgi:hypothetical protein
VSLDDAGAGAAACKKPAVRLKAAVEIIIVKSFIFFIIFSVGVNLLIERQFPDALPYSMIKVVL